MAPIRSSDAPVLSSLAWLSVVQHMQYKIVTPTTNTSSANNRTTTVLIRSIPTHNVFSYHTVDRHGATCRYHPAGHNVWNTHLIELRRTLPSTGFQGRTQDFDRRRLQLQHWKSLLWVLGHIGAVIRDYIYIYIFIYIYIYIYIYILWVG